MIIDTHAVNALLASLGISVGVVFVLAALSVAAIGIWRRRDRSGGIRAIEQHLAAVAGHRRPAHSG